MALKHATVATTPDDGVSEVGKDEWNADHVVDAGGIVIDSSGTPPSTPAAGKITLYAEGTDADKDYDLHYLDALGFDRQLQTALFDSKLVFLWLPQVNATASLAGTLTATGTATAANISGTNAFTRSAKVEYLVTTAATTAVAGYRSAGALVTCGGNAAGVGGFEYNHHFYAATGVATATNKGCFGLTGATGAATDTGEVSAATHTATATGCIICGWDSTDTNMQMMHRTTNGTMTKIDLGANFPVPSADRTSFYKLQLFSPSGTTQTVYYKVTNMVTGDVSIGTITTNLPSTTQYLTHRGHMSVGGTSSVIGVGSGATLIRRIGT